MVDSRHGARSSGFTLVELLVVIAIIGVLVSLLLPAVQSAREAARRAHCTNNLKQVGVGWLNHESSYGFLPSGGWSPWVVGDPDKGTGAEQPGGWMYQILPYVEQQALYRLPSDGQRDVITSQQKTQSLELQIKPVSIFNCPSRRPAATIPWNATPPATWIPKNSDRPTVVVCGDYAANGGDAKVDKGMGYLQTGQATLDPSDDTPYPDGEVFKWVLPNAPGYYTTPVSTISRWPPLDSKSGVNFIGSEIEFQHISDGTTNTYMVGEKNLNPDSYDGSKESGGDNHSYYQGFDWDTHRFSAEPPIQDSPGFDLFQQFGSAHPGTWHAVLCDGSVRAISYDIDLMTHKRLANRNDGESVGSF